LSFKDFKPLIILSVFILMIIGFVYVVSLYWPRYEEYFFELGLLGKEGKAEDYFPNDNSSVFLGTPMSWKIYVHNHMGGEQDVLIKVRLLNSTMKAPDDRLHEPSPYPSFVELPVSLSIDETVLIPFSFSVLDAVYDNGTVIKAVIVNGDFIDVDVKDNSTDGFRVVFEIWVYDESMNQYSFGWYSKDEFYSASIYMWFIFNLTYV